MYLSAGWKPYKFMSVNYGQCVCVCVCVCLCSVCVWLCDPIDCSLPGSCVHAISQARILDWVAIIFSRESPWAKPVDPTLAGGFFTTAPPVIIQKRNKTILLWLEFLYWERLWGNQITQAGLWVWLAFSAEAGGQLTERNRCWWICLRWGGLWVPGGKETHRKHLRLYQCCHPAENFLGGQLTEH